MLSRPKWPSLYGTKSQQAAEKLCIKTFTSGAALAQVVVDPEEDNNNSIKAVKLNLSIYLYIHTQ